MFSRRVVQGVILGLLTLAFTSYLGAQTQPPAAINAQDERVNINKEVGADVSNFTIFRSGDKAEINRYYSEVIELKRAVGFEVLPHVLRAVERERGVARALRFKDADTGQERHFIQVITTVEQMPSVIATIKALDLPGVVSWEGDAKYHYRLKYRRASEVADVLSRTSLTAEGRAAADDATNTIYVQDSESDTKRHIAAIKFYDVPAPQVEFEVLAVEIDKDKEARLGLDWDSWKRALGGQFEFTGNRFEGGDSFARLDALVVVDAGMLASFLNYTVQNGTGEVRTRTNVTASNNRAAIVSSLKRIPSFGYTTFINAPAELTEATPGVTASGEDSSGAVGSRPVVIMPPTLSLLGQTSVDSASPGASSVDPSLLVGEKAEGIYLRIQPTIGTETVTADVRVVVNSLAGYTKLDAPIISERLITTTVALDDEKPFSLGGLEKETTVKVRRGIPGLRDLPWVKYLFSVEAETTEQSKIYIVVTPRVRNQVLFNSPGLLGTTLDVEPGLTVNTLPPPEE
ncbi:MAG: hypothetical protein V2A74_13380 [bacterium]